MGDSSSAAGPVTPDSTPQPPAPTAADRFHAAATKAKALALSLAGSCKAAAQLVAKQTERTKLTKITLPNAYQAVGRHIHGAGSFRADFADTYERIDALLDDIARLTATAPAVEGFQEKVKAVVKAAKDKAHAQVLQLKLRHAYTELGKAVFDKHGDKSGPTEVVQPILDGLVRLKTLAAEIAEVSKSEPGTVLTPKRIAIGGLAVAALLLLLVVKMTFLGGSTDERQVAKNVGEAEQSHPADVEHAATDIAVDVKHEGTKSPEVGSTARWSGSSQVGPLKMGMSAKDVRDLFESSYEDFEGIESKVRGGHEGEGADATIHVMLRKRYGGDSEHVGIRREQFPLFQCGIEPRQYVHCHFTNDRLFRVEYEINLRYVSQKGAFYHQGWIGGQTHDDQFGAELTAKEVLDFFNKSTEAARGKPGGEGVVVTLHDTGWSERLASEEDKFRARTISIVYTSEAKGSR